MPVSRINAYSWHRRFGVIILDNLTIVGSTFFASGNNGTERTLIS